jgi:hypothetical protein
MHSVLPLGTVTYHLTTLLRLSVFGTLCSLATVANAFHCEGTQIGSPFISPANTSAHSLLHIRWPNKTDAPAGECDVARQHFKTGHGPSKRTKPAIKHNRAACFAEDYVWLSRSELYGAVMKSNTDGRHLASLLWNYSCTFYFLSLGPQMENFNKNFAFFNEKIPCLEDGLMRDLMFWQRWLCDVTPFSPLQVNRRVLETCRLLLQGWRTSEARSKQASKTKQRSLGTFLTGILPCSFL